jgi:hypothetical protein
MHARTNFRLIHEDRLTEIRELDMKVVIHQHVTLHDNRGNHTASILRRRYQPVVVVLERGWGCKRNRVWND